MVSIHEPNAKRNDKGPGNSLLTERVDLREAIEHGVEAPPELEPGIVLAGLTHMIYGPSSSGKTWILLYLIVRLLEADRRVVYFDSENGKRIIAERLSELGVDPAKLENLYYFPFPSLHADEKGRERYVDLLGEVEPDLVAFDATVNFLASCGLEENSNDDFVKWSTHYTRPARERNIAVLLLDHTPHEGGHARGASRKRDEVDVMWAAKCPVPFDRETTETVILRREKDREGWLPKSVVFNIGGTDEHGHIVCARTERPVIEVEDDRGLTASARRVLDVLHEEFGANGAKYGKWLGAAEGRGIPKPTFDRARRALVSRHGLVRQVNDTYFPVSFPDGGGDGDTRENGSRKPDSGWYHEVSDWYHDTDDTGAEEDGITGITPLEGDTSDTSAETNSVSTSDGIVSDDKRHSQVEPESERKNGREGKVSAGEDHSDSPAPSLAVVEGGASPGRTMSVVAPDVRLTDDEVSRIKELRRQGMSPTIAREEVLRRRRQRGGGAA
jgi:hypothetical protein